MRHQLAGILERERLDIVATATSLLFAPAPFAARRITSPTASASTIAFSLMAFWGVGSAA
jgi:hypothetical protein